MADQDAVGANSGMDQNAKAQRLLGRHAIEGNDDPIGGVSGMQGHQPTKRRKVFLPNCSTLPSSSAAEANSWLGSVIFSPSRRAAPPLI